MVNKLYLTLLETTVVVVVSVNVLVVVLFVGADLIIYRCGQYIGASEAYDRYF